MCSKNSDKIEFIRLDPDNFDSESLNGFVLNQRVTKCWRKADGEYRLVPVSYTEDWDLSARRKMSQKIIGAVKSGSLAVGAVKDGEVIGFALLDRNLFGGDNGYMDLCEFYVSEPFRRRGIGKILFEKISIEAKNSGAGKLYISAHSAEESISAYRKYGCVFAVSPDKSHVEQEPCDLQLEFDLKNI